MVSFMTWNLNGFVLKFSYTVTLNNTWKDLTHMVTKQNPKTRRHTDKQIT